MAHIEGVAVSDGDAWWIVSCLRAVGRADDATAAFAIELALGAADDVDVDWLTPSQKDAILLALAGAPDSLLPLRSALAHEHRQRRK